MADNILCELALSSEGHIYLDDSSNASETLSLEQFAQIKSLFLRDQITTLLHLGIQDFGSLPSSFSFWQAFAKNFVAQVCKLTNATDHELHDIPPLNDLELQELVNEALFKGCEYLSIDLLKSLWLGLAKSLKNELKDFKGSAQDYFKFYNPGWNLVGRVCFHLAENKNDQANPFAFLATYTTQLSKGSAQHLPLKRALLEYAGKKESLLALLLPVQKAASQSPFLKELVDSGNVFQPLLWTAKEAHKFLQEISLMELSGIMVRVPNWWNSKKPVRAKVAVKIGEKADSVMGLGSLLDFDIELALSSGEKLTQEEFAALLKTDGSLIKIKGEWVEVDKDKLSEVLSYWNKLQKGAKNGISMAEGLRLLAGGGANILSDTGYEEAEEVAEWSTVVAGDFLKKILDELKSPDDDDSIENNLKKQLKGTLRPYQLKGVKWLWMLYQLKLGGCLADDMGLGKTIQVLCLLLLIKNSSLKKKTHLLVAPASLIGNWQAEIARFSPQLKIMIAHSSVNKGEVDIKQLANFDLVITTYGYIHRFAWPKEVDWDLVILDEAQTIKNPDTKQSRFVKELKSEVRITLTGTPIENRLSDLWSLFDFILPGLLGSAKTFSTYAKKANQENLRFIPTIRNLTQPYILRRLKSDKKIIQDLPDKTEMQTYCFLSKEQVKLYSQSIIELQEQLKAAEGIKRRGIVLSYLLRFKQICNHPTQWLGYGEYGNELSGKFIRLQEICEEIFAKQEKVLVFTQFKEIIPALFSLLSKVFGKEGLILHGETSVKKRPALVAEFQEEMGPPFFILSLKAGGTGLNLTRASHVIHFDRWWNPAVENQATDRAYRIGQKHPVMEHKFICRGTIEEKIDDLITSKKNLSTEVLEGGKEILLTEMNNEELLHLFSLDIQKALGEF
ncbi:MAG: DEAD/DEAH box helicase [Chlamydiae bacterium]|nr:DEAD/DEAH box helicase [Chlamydiota bacterium]